MSAEKLLSVREESPGLTQPVGAGAACSGATLTWEREHLWLYVLGLGFQPGPARDRGVPVERDMFDTPNYGAFFFVAHFLFAKLDMERTEKIFGVLPFEINIQSLEFRKQCCKWLKEIIKNEDKGHLSQVTPSSFVSPVCPKITDMLYHLARHVMAEDLTKHSGTDIPFTEPVKLTPENMYMERARCRLAYNKLLQFFQKEEFFFNEYQKKSKLLIKEIEQIQSENADLETQCCKMKHSDQIRNDKMEKIRKVRSMWTLIMEVLTSVKKEKEIVDSILDENKDCVDQCILDGTKVVFRVPQLLACRVEAGILELGKGNVYERENLNCLTVIQLLNEALKTLRDESCLLELNQQIWGIEDKATKYKKILDHLKEKSLKIEQEHYVSVLETISRKQKDWEVKWKNFLDCSPLELILLKDPEFHLSALPPRCFNFTEDDDKDIWYQHSVSDDCGSLHEDRYEEDGGTFEAVVHKPSPPRWLSSVPLELSKASENEDVLIEKNLPVEPCKGEKKPPRVLKNEKDNCTVSEMWENIDDHVVQTEASVKDPVGKASDELAEEVAKAVMSESLQGDGGKEIPLEDLINSLAFDPFLTRTQIPRTPENLLTEIRSSWRKAVKTEGSSDIELYSTEVMIEEAPMDARPIRQKTADSRFQCSTSASPLPDSYLSLSEFKSQLISTEFRPQEQMSISHISKSSILETPEKLESEITEEQGASVEDPEEQSFQFVNRMSTPGICSKNNRTNTLSSDHVSDSLRDEVLPGYGSSLPSPVWELLGEMLPEDLSYLHGNEFASSESDFDVIDSADVIDGSKNKGNIKKSKLNIQSLFNTHKALENTASRSEEELHETHNGGESVSCRSDLSFTQEKGGGFYDPVEFFCLDEEFTKTPSSASLDERKYSLSSLLVSCQELEEMASVVQEIPLDLNPIIQKLKNKEKLSEELDTKEPSSG